MQVELPYGHGRLVVDIPVDGAVTVVAPRHPPALPDPRRALREALAAPIDTPPLTSLARRAERIGIIFNDVTRPTPSELLVGEACATLEGAGVAPAQITLFNATGTHRANSDTELRTMLGDRLVDRYRIVQNEATATGAHRRVGVTRRGTEVELHAELLACDLKILTGFIEPHFFAGFSGGPKAVMPGMAALSTIARNHDAAHIDHTAARWGVREGNPLWEEIRECAGFAGECFLINVTLDRDQAITGLYVGALEAAHAAGCARVSEDAMVPVDAPFDVVLTSNSGYPLDQNLYQCVKGMSAAAQITRPGGLIILAAACSDGVPDHGAYGRLWRAHPSPERLLAAVRSGEGAGLDAWQAQVQARICLAATVAVYSDGLTAQQIRGAGLEVCDDVAAALRSRCAEPARLCVLPEGPQTIPYLRAG